MNYSLHDYRAMQRDWHTKPGVEADLLQVISRAAHLASHVFTGK
jgi:hypothetical protein